MRSSPVTVSIQGVTKSYGVVKALEEVSLVVCPGEFVTLLGPSGSGKTTLLMALAGFVRPDSGNIKFDGTEILGIPPHRRDVAVVFQNYALFPHMDVFENVAYPLRQRPVPKHTIAQRVEAALSTVRLDGFEMRRVDALSGGEKQRVALARAIVFEPRLLLMDEPLSALDKQLREQMQLELRNLHERLGVTTVYVTHDQREAHTMSDRIAVMHHGRLEQLDTPRALYERPRTRFVAEFVGECTLLPVEQRPDGVWLNSTLLRTAVRPTGKKNALLLVRPEKLTLGVDAKDPAINKLTGVMEQYIFQGDNLLVHVRLADGTKLAARYPTRREILALLPAPGEAITLGLHAEDAMLVDNDS